MLLRTPDLRLYPTCFLEADILADPQFPSLVLEDIPDFERVLRSSQLGPGTVGMRSLDFPSLLIVPRLQHGDSA
jgi:hypothetical protein